jgi:hypothetical protein
MLMTLANVFLRYDANDTDRLVWSYQYDTREATWHLNHSEASRIDTDD